MYRCFWSPHDFHWRVQTDTGEILALCHTMEQCVESMANARYESDAYDLQRECLRNMYRGMVRRRIATLKRQRARKRRKK